MSEPATIECAPELVRRHPARAGNRAADDSTSRGDPVRVLIVEDNPGDAELMIARLMDVSGVAFTATISSSLAAALAELRASSFEIVMLDLNLPDSRGLATLREVRNQHPSVPVVVVSGGLADELRSAALEQGAHEVITKDEAGSRLFALSVLYVVERNRADESRRQFEKLLDASPDAVIVVDAPGHVRYVNDAAVELFGRERQELTHELLTFAAKEGVPVELRIPRMGSHRVAEMRVVDFEWRGDHSALAFIRDVTEQKKMEMQLLLSDRMVSIGTLAAGVAHEINNPLASIVANLDLAVRDANELSRRMAVPADLLDELDDAREAADRVREIVRDLKIFSRPEDDKLGPVDVHRVIESSLRMAWNEMRHRAHVVKDFGKVPPAEANESRLGQVLLNLLVNAAQAIPEGDQRNNEIRVQTRTTADGRIAITISDTGAGIPPDVQRRMFTPFFTTKPVGAGTGLGLAICHRIITALGGEIGFESEVGSGTKFFLVLPGADLELPVASPARTEETLASVRSARVLVVDDELMIVHAVRRVLAPDHEVDGLEDATQALEQLRRGADYDVIFCDLMMPQMTGMEFYAAVKSLGSGIEQRIVFMTGGAFTPNARAFLDAVPNHRVEKPFDMQGLRALVNSLTRNASS